MRKRTGGIIFVIILIVFIASYYTISAFNQFVDDNAALVTALSILLAIFLWWLSRNENINLKPPDNITKTEEKIQETLEKEVAAILSPVSSLCIGRDTELSQLEKDVTHKNVLLIKGIAGIGKTTLGLKFRDILEKKGYHTFWHQFGSQSYERLLVELSDYLKDRGSASAVELKDQAIPPEKRLRIAVHELCTYQTVLFLDNFQLLDDSDFKIFVDYLRNSHVVIMSRVQPKFLSEDYDNLEYLDKNSSVNLLKTLKVEEPQEVLESIYEKTRGHPWSLMCFKRLSRALPVKDLLDELPDFSKKQESYISEQCWRYLHENERDFLMRASVFVKPLDFDALKVCTRTGLSDVIVSLAESFYILKRGNVYYIHDIMKGFSLLKLREKQEFYSEAHRGAAHYYGEKLSAENLLLMYYHLKEAKDYEAAVKSVVYNIDYFWREGFWSDVREVLEESLDFVKDEKIISDIYDDLGSIVEGLGQWDKAIEYYEKSLEIKEKVGDIHGMAQTYGNLGLVYDSKGQWDTAIEYYEKSLEISEKIGDIHGMAQTYNNLGLVYDSKGQWDTAIEYYEKSLEISEKIGDIHGMAQTYGNLGSVYGRKGQWDTAIEYYEKDLEIREKVGDIHGMAQTYNNLGLVYDSKGQWDTAIEYYEKSLEIKEKVGDIHGMAQTYNNLGSVYDSKDQWDTAIEYYEKSLEIKEKVGDIHGMAITKYGIANILRNKKEFDDALKLYFESEKVLKSIGDTLNLMNVYSNLDTCYQDMNQPEKAKEYYQKAEELRKKLKIENP
ncbi:MAG: tetratricopeptide repeat protein [Theionarchaea archaeon]|nr:tetratricopeptide repeat protein [Theionarchaea archaeon]